ncbi:MAG: hypothetical protein RLZZ516_2375 [Cyanobacteriota bacterium]
MSQEASLTASRILALREQQRTLITDHLGRAAANGHRVLESLFDRPIVSVNAIEQLIATTYPSVNSLVARLEALGILREMTGQKRRHRRFCCQPYIALFGDSPQNVGA